MTAYTTLSGTLKLPRVQRVESKPGHQLEITFTNGEVGVYDCSGLLDFGVFRELRDEGYFRRARVVQGTVAWPHEQDICPDTLYLDSRKMTSEEGIAGSATTPR
jgi:hypothetical protein